MMQCQVMHSEDMFLFHSNDYITLLLDKLLNVGLAQRAKSQAASGHYQITFTCLQIKVECLREDR